MKKIGIWVAGLGLTLLAGIALTAPPATAACQNNCAPGISYNDWTRATLNAAPAQSKPSWGLTPTIWEINDNFNFHEKRKSKFDGSNLLFMIMGVGGIGAAIAFGGGGGSGNKSAPPQITATVAPPTTLAIKGYQIHQGISYAPEIKITTQINQHVIMSCLLTTSMSALGNTRFYTHKSGTTTLKSPQRHVTVFPPVAARQTTVTLSPRHFAETLTVSVDITTSALLGITTTARVARQVAIYNPEPITITFTQISSRMSITQNIINTATVVHALAANKISVEVEGRTPAEQALARKLVALPSNGIFSVTIINRVTLRPVTTPITTTLDTIKYNNRMFAFTRGNTLKLTLNAGTVPVKTITLMNDIDGEYLTSLAVNHTMHLYGVNFNHTLANLIDNKYITTVTGENNHAVTLTTYSPRQALSATLLFNREEPYIQITRTTTTTSSSTMTVTTTMTLQASLTGPAQTIMMSKGVYLTAAASNNGKTIYILSPYKINTDDLVKDKFKSQLNNRKLLIFKRYTDTSKKDRFIQLSSSFFRGTAASPDGQFHSIAKRWCINPSDADNIKVNGRVKHFYLDQRAFTELAGSEEIFPIDPNTGVYENILRFNYYGLNERKFKMGNFAFSGAAQLNDLAAEYSTQEYVSGRLRLQAAAGIRHLRDNNTKAQYYANYLNYALGPPLKGYINNRHPRWRISAHFVGGRLLSDYYENGRLLGYGGRLYGSNILTPGDFWHVGINSPFADRRLNYKILTLGTVLGDTKQNLIMDYSRVLNTSTDYIKFKYQRNFQ